MQLTSERKRDATPRKGGAWSRDEIRDLVRLWPHHDNTEIARRLGRNENAVAIKASRLGLPPRLRAAKGGGPSLANGKPGAKVRPCLSCRTPFFSEGPHNRICDGCKSGSPWQTGGNSYVVSLG